eukprot:365799-Chlamydomonas_euryale.AAC.3
MEGVPKKALPKEGVLRRASTSLLARRTSTVPALLSAFHHPCQLICQPHHPCQLISCTCASAARRRYALGTHTTRATDQAGAHTRGMSTSEPTPAVRPPRG